MRSTNKVAKYVAIALGLILAIFIISVIVKTTLGIFGAFRHFGKNAASSSVTNKEFSQEFNGVTSLDLDYSAGYLEIQKGDVFRIEGYNLPNNFTVEQRNDTLKIKDSIKDPINFLNTLSDSQKPHLTVTIPEGTAFKEVDLDFGASDTRCLLYTSEKTARIAFFNKFPNGRQILRCPGFIVNPLSLIHIRCV